MSTSTLFVHVPADEIEIVHGSLKYSELFFFMGLTQDDKSIEMKATLRTPASKRTFTGTITITAVPQILNGRRSDDHATIIGTFAGQPFEGTYRTKSQKGNLRAAD